MLQRGEHDLGSKRQRGGDGPWRQRAIIGPFGTPRASIRGTPRDLRPGASWDRTVTRRDAPGMLPVLAEALRIRMPYCWFT